jgi:hypothetical protein
VAGGDVVVAYSVVEVEPVQPDVKLSGETMRQDA